MNVADPLRRSGWAALASLFTSSGTLVCCTLPALLVALGAGGALAGLVSTFPQIVWLSEHKVPVFGAAAAMLAVAGVLQWRGRSAPCPIEPTQRDACLRLRARSAWVYGASLALFALGALFAFVLPVLMG